MASALVLSFADPPVGELRARRVTLPAPGGEPALRELAGRFAAERPAEPWLAVDPADAGFHLLVEGGLSALESDGDEDGGLSVPDVVAQLVWEAARLPLRAAGAVRHPARTVGGMLATGERVLGAATSSVWPRPDTPYEDGAPPDVLRLAWVRFEADRLAPLTGTPGAGVDEVLASAVTRALRDDLDRLGHDAEAGDESRLAAELLAPAARPPGDPRVAGRAPREIRPVPLPREGLALGLAALRDDDGVTVGIAADPRVLDPDVLAGELEATVQELLDAAAAAAPVPAEPPASREETGPAVDLEAPPDPLPGEPEPPVETPTELVAESADAGAQDGAGPQVRVDEPWDGYASMTAQEIVDRLDAASDEELAVVAMYEALHRDRRTVVEAAERALSRNSRAQEPR